MWAAAAAPTWLALAAALLVAGALDAIVDVAQNAHGLRVQRHYGRSILNAFHGIWSIGAVAGGLLGSAAAGPRRSRSPCTWASSRASSPSWPSRSQRATAPGIRRRRPRGAAGRGTDGAAPAPVRVPVLLRMAALGVLAACGAFVEDAGASWSALYLRDELAAGAATAGLGFVALSIAMTIGRLTGDRFVDRFGQRRVARVGGALTALGMGLALAVPSLPTTLLGFALAGLGVATLIPAVYHAADELPGLRRGVGLAVVNWLLRIGFLLSPLVIGVLADATSLRVALLTVVVAGLGTLVLGRVLPRTVNSR